MMNGLLTIVLVSVVLFLAARLWVVITAAPNGRWFSSGVGVVEQWRLTGSHEDVLARRLQRAMSTIDASVVDALGRPDLRWRLTEASELIRQQLLTCSRLPAQARPAVRREVESMVVEFEAVCARLLLDAARSSSSVVRERLRGIEESVDALREARTEIEQLGT